MMQSERSFSVRRALIMVGTIISVSLYGNGMLMSQSKSTVEPRERQRVVETADQFAQRFHETLDFGAVFNEMFVADAKQRRRNAKIFLKEFLSSQISESIDDKALVEAFIALMNVYYLKAAYELSQGDIKSRQETVTPPNEVTLAMRSSRFFRQLTEDGNNEEITIRTIQELKQFIADANRISQLYRSHLPKSVFHSTRYQTNVKRLGTGVQVSPQIERGNPDFGLDENVKIFVIEKEIFRLFFVEENGQYKVLTVGVGGGRG